MDLSPRSHPAAGPSPGNLLSPGALSFSSRLPAPGSEQGGRLHGAEQLPFFPEQMTLGQAGTARPEFRQPCGRQPRLSAPLPLSSQGANLHLGPFQTQRDSGEALVGDPGP